MRELDTLEKQKSLLPKESDVLFMVFFYGSSPKSLQLRSKWVDCEAIPGFERVAVNLERAPALAERFALGTLPVVAVVFDGTILCIDDDLSHTSCVELARLARRQRQSLLEVTP